MKKQKKVFTAPIELKTVDEGQETGEFRAVFATFNVVDYDGDVTIPGAFKEQETIVEPWNHGWTLPGGKGVIKSNDKEAWIEGQFFLDTEVGRETHRTVKNLGPLAQWSYTFNILKSGQGDHNGDEVRFLQEMDVVGVSPVTRGAGIDTRTVAIKSDEEKPYPNEHACRLRDPDDFQPDNFVRTTRKHDGKEYSVIQGRLEGETELTDQAFRYKNDVWTATQARLHCQAHDGSFEAATDDDEASGDGNSDAGKSSVDINMKINLAEIGLIMHRLEIER